MSHGYLESRDFPSCREAEGCHMRRVTGHGDLEDEERATSQGLRSLWKLEKKPPEEPALQPLALAPGDHVRLLPSSLYSSHRICTHCTRHFRNCLLRAQELVSGSPKG